MMDLKEEVSFFLGWTFQVCQSFNSGTGPGGAPINVDFLFGLEKGIISPPPPVKIHSPAPEPVTPPPPPHRIPEMVENLVVRLLWHLLHVIVSLWYFVQGIAELIESYFISRGILRKYKSLHIGKLRYLAIVVESEDAYQTSKIVELLEWLVDIGVNRVCLYDKEGILKKSKEFILAKLNDASLLEDSHDEDVLVNQKGFTLEFASFSDGKEAVAKAANVLLSKYSKSNGYEMNQEDQNITEADMTEALKAVGCVVLEPDLMLVYGPVRCHLGFPAWRMRYTEIIHMGPLKSMRRGSLIKAIHAFTMVRQNYGK